MNIGELFASITGAGVVRVPGSVEISISRTDDFILNPVISQCFEELPAVTLVVNTVGDGIAQEGDTLNTGAIGSLAFEGGAVIWRGNIGVRVQSGGGVKGYGGYIVQVYPVARHLCHAAISEIG